MNIGMTTGGYLHYAFDGDNPSFNEADTQPVAMPTGGTGGTPTAWAQLIASTEEDASGFLLFGRTDAGTGFTAEVGIGAAASETAIAQVYFPEVTRQLSYVRDCPISIPAGTRVAFRGYNQSSGESSAVGIIPYSGGAVDYLRGSYITMDGMNANISRVDPDIDPGGSADTKGSWVEISSSAPGDVVALSIVTDIGTDTSLTTQQWLVDVGIGAAASEEVILSNLFFAGNATIDIPNNLPPWFPVNIPEGTRIAMRCQGSLTTVGERELHAGLQLLHR